MRQQNGAAKTRALHDPVHKPMHDPTNTVYIDGKTGKQIHPTAAELEKERKKELARCTR